MEQRVEVLRHRGGQDALSVLLTLSLGGTDTPDFLGVRPLDDDTKTTEEDTTKKDAPVDLKGSTWAKLIGAAGVGPAILVFAIYLGSARLDSQERDLKDLTKAVTELKEVVADQNNNVALNSAAIETMKHGQEQQLRKLEEIARELVLQNEMKVQVKYLEQRLQTLEQRVDGLSSPKE